MTLIIPDIHADLTRLELALAYAGDGPIAFLGDFIDQGPWSKEKPTDGAVLNKVRELIESGRAVAVMGNHELNAILYHRYDAGGHPLRKHSKKNTDQHKSFLEEFGLASDKALAWTSWFLEALPLWHEGDGFRLVHAYWSDEDIDLVKRRRPDGHLQLEDLPEIASENTPFGQAVKRLTSGPEITLPDGYYMTDVKGKKRREVRFCWWRAAGTWRDAALSVPDMSTLPDLPLPPEFAALADFSDAPPTFIGHYKMMGNPKFENSKVICLDYPYSACVYRFDREAQLLSQNLIDATRMALSKPAPPLGPNHPAITRRARVVFSVGKDHEAAVKEALGIDAEAADSDTFDIRFIWSTWYGDYMGDDETILYRLGHALGKDVKFSINWQASQY